MTLIPLNFPVQTSKFSLANEPVDYQLSVHFTNMMNTKHIFGFTKENFLVLLNTYLQYPELIEGVLLMRHYETLNFQLANMINHYGIEKVNQFAMEVFFIEPLLVAVP